MTGDDFGLRVPVNEAIEHAHKEGILTAASLMVGAAAAADAVERAHRLPSLRVGLHVVVVRGRPVLPPERIPDLVEPNGTFPSDLMRAGINLFFRPSARQQLEAEIRAQLQKFLETGLALDHVNAHHHMHLHPTVLDTILKVGCDYGLKAMRVPYEPFHYSWRASREGFLRRLGTGLFLGPWIAVMKRRLRKVDVRCNDYVFGMNDSGRMSADLLLRYLANLPQGTSEIYFHPAVGTWPDTDVSMESSRCEQEFRALTSSRVVKALRHSDIQPIAFSDLTERFEDLDGPN